MRKLGVAVVLIAMMVPVAWADEEPGEKKLESRIDSVDLFKNGIAVVRQVVDLPGSGTYSLYDVPQPVHGTYWIESDGLVTTRVEDRVVEVMAEPSTMGDFQQGLIGQEVTVYFTDGRIPEATGRVANVVPRDADSRWSRAYERTQYPRFGYPYLVDQQSQLASPFLVLETQNGRHYVKHTEIAYLHCKGGVQPIKRRVPTLVLERLGEKPVPTKVVISYLTKGVSWAPSYRVDISDGELLSIRQKAVVKNELGELTNASISLIAGYPSIQFSHVTSPLSLETSLASFFSQLNQRFGEAHGYAGQSMSQMVMSNVAMPTPGIDISSIPAGQGVDLHYEDIGRHTLLEGQSLALEVATGVASYESIVEWIVPDTRKPNGSMVNDYERRQEPEKYKDAAWDAVRFKNPLPFPMTTGPAMVVSDGRFCGQRMSTWVNTGEQTTLHITKALSIRTRFVEHEESGSREDIYILGHTYHKATVKGELWINNHRAETVKLVTRRRFSGDLLEADHEPVCTLVEEGVYCVNKRNELFWTTEVGPGQEVKLSYRYEVLVRR